MIKNPGLNKRLIGKQAQARGEMFEVRLDAMARMEGVQCTRVPDGCKQAYGRLMRVKSPFDFILSYGDKIALIDCKVRAGDKINKGDVTEHQLNELLKHKNAAISGYLVYHRESDKVRFYSAHDMASKNFMGIELGTLAKFRVRTLFEAVI